MAKQQSLNITFILPFVNLTGGIKILFEHANRLAKRGHRVTIIYPGRLFHDNAFGMTNRSWRWRLIEAPLRWLKYLIFVDLLHQTEASWFSFDSRVKLHRTPDLSAHYIPSADIVIATAPETVDWVATYPASKGIKVHFAQDYEVWYLPASFVNGTFRHKAMHLITIGKWQKELYEGEFGHPVERIIPNGINTDQFYVDKSKRAELPDEPIRVLMSYHHAEYKGIPEGLAAIEGARKAGYKIQTVMFGVHPLKSDIPRDVEYHFNISEEKLPDLYRSCDIFLWPTHREGFGLPPMEAMACGLAVIGTATGALPDYLEDGKTGFIVPIKRPDLLEEKLLILLKNPELRQKIGQQAATAIKEWDWDRQNKKLEEYLTDLYEQTTRKDKNG